MKVGVTYEDFLEKNFKNDLIHLRINFEKLGAYIRVVGEPHVPQPKQ